MLWSFMISQQVRTWIVSWWSPGMPCQSLPSWLSVPVESRLWILSYSSTLPSGRDRAPSHARRLSWKAILWDGWGLPYKGKMAMAYQLQTLALWWSYSSKQHPSGAQAGMLTCLTCDEVNSNLIKWVFKKDFFNVSHPPPTYEIKILDFCNHFKLSFIAKAAKFLKNCLQLTYIYLAGWVFILV